MEPINHHHHQFSFNAQPLEINAAQKPLSSPKEMNVLPRPELQDGTCIEWTEDRLLEPEDAAFAQQPMEPGTKYCLRSITYCYAKF